MKHITRDKKQQIILALEVHVSYLMLYRATVTQKVQTEAVTEGVHRIFACLETEIALSGSH